MDVSDVRTGFTKTKDDVGIRCQKLFQDFLEEFKEDNKIKYLEQCVVIGNNMERNMLEVSFEDVENYNQKLAETIIEEYYRIDPYLRQALTNVIKDRIPPNSANDRKTYYISFVDVPSKHLVRELRSVKIGTLVRMTGQTVRTHPVHPELVYGTFTCLDCQTVIPKVEQQFKFTYPAICRNPVCNNRRRFNLEINKSIFVDFQKVKVQETQAELPRGSIPRSVDVILRAEVVEKVQAGDQYDFTGTLIVVPDVGALSLPGAKADVKSRHKTGDGVTDGVRGLKALGVRDLNYKLAFLACSVVPSNPRFYGIELADGEELNADYLKKQMTEAEWNKVFEMNRDKNRYANLTESLFPSIFGNEQVKKGIVLMLFSGVPKRTTEGTQLRGDINCCIVGDPSTSKSQFLKQVAELCPRSVYTSGKASTAAGLTAAVVRDEESGDFVIEAGALLLADNGICCIDEFDKMDLHDQVAIHEAMEQQTISIAKAGVRATLHARSSILAAANPIGGRYDRTKSLQQNVSLSAPIMSRFDLFFVLIDECNETTDYRIAETIISLHSNLEKEVPRKYTQDEVLRYIFFGKQFKPKITPEAKELLVNCYTQLRQRDSQSTSRGTWRITVRQLESLIRLSEAMAKMECSDDVLVSHVEEAYALLNKSIIRVEQPDVNLEEDADDPSPMEVSETTGEENADDETASEELQPKKKLSLPFEEYKRLTNIIVTYIRNEEDKRAGDGFEGLKKSDVIEHYLGMIQESIDNEEELVDKKVLIEKTLERLMFKDHVLIPLTTEGRSGGEEELENNPIITVHPNYCVL